MTRKSKTAAVILFAHGSRVDGANRGVHKLAREIEARGPYPYVRAAFLELAQPSLAGAVARAVKAGYGRVIVLPYFLTMGVHLRRDFPKLLAAEKEKHPGLELEAGQPLEDHPLLASMILERVREAEAKF